jgi:hypothetical protein
LTALGIVAELITSLKEKLPKGTRIWVSADHGMVNAQEKIIFGQDNDLNIDVTLYGGEPRARHLYVTPGSLLDVKSRYEKFLGDKADIYTKEEAILANLFGSEVTLDSQDRIGDLLVIAKGSMILVDPERIKQEAGMVGHHGGLTEIESLIPLLAY